MFLMFIDLAILELVFLLPAVLTGAGLCKFGVFELKTSIISPF